MVAASVANKTSETACIKFCALSVSISVASRSAAASGEGRGSVASHEVTVLTSHNWLPVSSHFHLEALVTALF